MEKHFRLIKIALPLAVVALCIFGYVLHYQSEIFREFQAALLSVQWMLLVCIAIWCGSFIFLTFSLKDLPLIGLLLIAIFVCFIGEASSWRMADAIILFAGVTLGKGAGFLLKAESGNDFALVTRHPAATVREPGGSSLVTFLIGLVVLLAFSSWWHLDMAGAYHGPRWMGLWDNPNIYGMLMGAGLTLAIGLLISNQQKVTKRTKIQCCKSFVSSVFFCDQKIAWSQIILCIGAFMMGVGLMFCYSRGAWVGTAVGLLYLAKASGKAESGKRKAKIIWYLLPIVVIASAAVVIFFWHNTADTGAWYLKRLDFSRPSAQHRVAAWKAGFEIMRDHPLGVGWNQAVGVYDKDYSPPENGAAALTMNSYLMLGTELGLPGLICFLAYVWLSFRQKIDRLEAYPTLACRAGAVVMLVAFWFDGGLFDLPTAAVFWILLELGKAQRAVPTVKMSAGL